MASPGRNAGRNISLTDHHRRFIEEQVAVGRHATASEVVHEVPYRCEADLARRAPIKLRDGASARYPGRSQPRG